MKKNLEGFSLKTILIFILCIGLFNFFSKKSNQSEINELIDLIHTKYVDEISREELKQKIIKSALSELDPHSSFISKKELSLVNESMQGHFSGIGVSFRIIEDTICIISVINNGPSMKKGILAGDKIIKVDNKLFVGDFLSNDTVMRKLKGVSGSEVFLTIKRPRQDSLLNFNIKRGYVEMSSIDAALEINSKFSYIRINRFSSNTYAEFMKAVSKIDITKEKKIILDLRSNPGGVLGDCYKVAEEFFDKGDLIFYTENRKNNSRKFKSGKNGFLNKNDVFVLIDENSASASEIIAGAIQDNDRGVIIGRRTFGKGLVQEQFELTNGSAVRLTTQKYFTPSGRLIQKPYKGFSLEQEKILNNIASGKILNLDSINFLDSVTFKTKKGRTVYGGGGIFPDVFVYPDTSNIDGFERGEIYLEILNYHMQNYILNHFDLDKIKSNYNINTFAIEFELTKTEINVLEKYYNKKNVQENYVFFNTEEEKVIKKYIKTKIAEMIWGNNGLHRCLIEEDLYIKKIKQLY